MEIFHLVRDFLVCCDAENEQDLMTCVFLILLVDPSSLAFFAMWQCRLLTWPCVEIIHFQTWAEHQANWVTAEPRRQEAHVLSVQKKEKQKLVTQHRDNEKSEYYDESRWVEQVNDREVQKVESDHEEEEEEKEVKTGDVVFDYYNDGNQNENENADETVIVIFDAESYFAFHDEAVE